MKEDSDRDLGSWRSCDVVFWFIRHNGSMVVYGEGTVGKLFRRRNNDGRRATMVGMKEMNKRFE
ncbi:hypothetical protein LR48_Vigan08g041500 [Vigna angularis]|uniref:Uncharacterized protein n=1 Tax=Phaseolus angularis TaxID=3914 RepID=A0A0L9V3G8_PHAAN|nr:hypothetical protein LR48_Vigan08g041500 [Vigna angularis]